MCADLLSIHAVTVLVWLLEGVGGGGEATSLTELNLIVNWLFVCKAPSMSDHQEDKQNFSI